MDDFASEFPSPRPGGDGRPWVTATVVGVDDAAGQLEVDVDGDGNTLIVPRVDGDYAVGDVVFVVTDPGGSGAPPLVVGTFMATRTAYPTTGTVVSVGSTTASVSTTAGVVTARMVTTTLTAGDVVRLDWPGGVPWILGRVATPPAIPSAPGAPTVTRSGSTWTASWSAVSGASSYAVHYSTDGGATWSASRTVTGTSTSGSIAEGQTVTVQVAATSGGGTSAWSASGSVTYPEAPPTETATATIFPTWSGTWRVDRAAWDRWNIDRDEYGGRSTLYQGDAHGSGTLIGLAVYGTQVRDLGALSIERIRVVLHGASLVEASYPQIDVRGSAQGTAAPSGGPVATGDTVTGYPGKSGVYKTSLTATQREDLRTGALRGLVLTGTGYAAVLGTDTADGMALLIDYTRARA